MYTGKFYSIKEVALWTRNDLITLPIIAVIPTFCYEVLGWKWLALPWLPIALVGTAVSFVIGFSNKASYDRLWEARTAWGGIVGASRSWGILVRDYITNTNGTEKISDEELTNIHRELYYRHFAWLDALRYQLREYRHWESVHENYNVKYKKKYFVTAEENGNLETELLKYLSEEETKFILSKSNRAAQLISQQSLHLKGLLDRGLLDEFRYMELERILSDLMKQQGISERIKNFPYPRQFSTVNLYFIFIFIFLLPMGMLKEFANLGNNLVWLTIPFSTIASWVFTMMEKVGRTSENPFEGGANDVPMTAISRSIEIDLRELLNETEIPQSIKPTNNILT